MIFAEIKRLTNTPWARRTNELNCASLAKPPDLSQRLVTVLVMCYFDFFFFFFFVPEFIYFSLAAHNFAEIYLSATPTF